MVRTFCLSVLVLAGCANPPEGRFRCDTAADCPDGWYCHTSAASPTQALCYSTSGTEMDAGAQSDGGPAIDAGANDGGPDGGAPSDAGGTDAGLGDAGLPDGGAPPTGYALRIPTSSARVLVPDTAGLFTDQFTWELWVSFDSAVASDPPQQLMTVEEDGYRLIYLRVLYGQLDCVVGNGGGDTRVSTPITGITSGDLHHIACTRSATAQELWVDGVRVGSVGPGAFPLPSSATTLSLGGDYRTPPEAWTFRGVIDEVRISNSVRYTADFVPERRHSVDANTLALWHFDEGTGTVAANAVGSSHTGTVDGALWVSEPAAP